MGSVSNPAPFVGGDLDLRDENENRNDDGTNIPNRIPTFPIPSHLLSSPYFCSSLPFVLVSHSRGHILGNGPSQKEGMRDEWSDG